MMQIKIYGEEARLRFSVRYCKCGAAGGSCGHTDILCTPRKLSCSLTLQGPLSIFRMKS